jgi:hypothetical protein
MKNTGNSQCLTVSAAAFFAEKNQPELPVLALVVIRIFHPL